MRVSRRTPGRRSSRRAAATSPSRPIKGVRGAGSAERLYPEGRRASRAGCRGRALHRGPTRSSGHRPASGARGPAFRGRGRAGPGLRSGSGLVLAGMTGVRGTTHGPPPRYLPGQRGARCVGATLAAGRDRRSVRAWPACCAARAGLALGPDRPSGARSSPGAPCVPASPGAGGAPPVLYVASGGDRTVTRLDAGSGRPLGPSLPVGRAPWQLATGPGGHLLLLATSPPTTLTHVGRGAGPWRVRQVLVERGTDAPRLAGDGRGRAVLAYHRGALPPGPRRAGAGVPPGPAGRRPGHDRGDVRPVRAPRGHHQPGPGERAGRTR